MALLDQTAIRESFNERSGGQRFTDSLLDLRISFARLRTHPEQAIRSFFRLIPILSKNDYLAAFRLRRLLQKEVMVAVGYGDRCLHLREIDFSWKNFERLVTHYRREAFEMSAEVLSFDQIEISFVWAAASPP